MYAVFLCRWEDYEKRPIRRITPHLTDVEEAKHIRDELILDGDLYAVFTNIEGPWLEV